MNSKGDYWNVKIDQKVPELGLGELLKPYQQPHPPIAMSIVREESMAATTGGKRGFIPISINMAPAHKVKRQWELYCAGAAEAGRPAPDRSIWRISRSIFVGASDEEAREHALNGAFAGSLMYLRGMLALANMLDLPKRDPEMPDEALDAEYFIDHIAIVGGVDTVKRKLQDLYDVTGGFGTVLMIAHDWDDKAKMRRSMELMAKEVIPQLP